VFTLPRTVRVWAYGRPMDLRKGYNGLVGIVENELRADPMAGELYLFVNGKRTQRSPRAVHTTSGFRRGRGRHRGLTQGRPSAIRTAVKTGRRGNIACRNRHGAP
jgi:hypothetical protein